MLSKLTEIMPGLHSFVEIFDRMAVAEAAIHEYMDRYPERKDEIFDSFMPLTPCQETPTTPPEAYDHHCRELLDRIIAGQPLEPATDAEVLRMVINCFTYTVPPNADGSFLILWLWKRVVGDHPITETFPQLQEPYDNYGEDELAKLKPKQTFERARSEPSSEPEGWTPADMTPYERGEAPKSAAFEQMTIFD